jgi:hypothetical protein
MIDPAAKGFRRRWPMQETFSGTRFWHCTAGEGIWVPWLPKYNKTYKILILQKVLRYPLISFLLQQEIATQIGHLDFIFFAACFILASYFYVRQS